MTFFSVFPKTYHSRYIGEKLTHHIQQYLRAVVLEVGPGDSVIVVSMYISLMIGDVEHLFIWVSFLEKCLSRVFAHFKIGLFGFFASKLCEFLV